MAAFSFLRVMIPFMALYPVLKNNRLLSVTGQTGT